MPAELLLVLTAESQVQCGLGLAKQFADRSDYSVAICVFSQGKDLLLEHIKGRLEQMGLAKEFEIFRCDGEVAELVRMAEASSELRLVLVAGLENWQELHEASIREIHATVACFESHADLGQLPKNVLVDGEDHREAVAWFADHWAAGVNVIPVTDEMLQNGTSNDAEKQTGSSAGASVGSSGNSGGHFNGDGASDETSESSLARMDACLVSVRKRDFASSRKRIRRLIEQLECPVIVVRGEVSYLRWLSETVMPGIANRYIPQMSREQRQQLATSLSDFSKLDFEFVVLICSATFLASFGLVQNSAAVIIGAMLVAPLMTPILGAGLSLAQGNRPLFASSVKTIVVGFFAALATSFLFGLLLQALPTSFFEQSDAGVVLTEEMWSRTTPTIIDFLVGFVGGCAAAFARTRGHLSSALAGAAIAAALVPPIATSGLQLSLSMRAVTEPSGEALAHNLVYGPALLFIANMLTIMVGSSIVLWACGVRSDHGYSPLEKWSTRMIMLLLILTAAVAVWIVQHP